jgi:hypothetical protein
MTAKTKTCERCHRAPAHPVSSRTMYEWDGEGEDPNADITLCAECAEEHNQIMDDQWAAARP